MPLAVVLILLVVGSLLFHLLSPWTFTELASNWGMVDFTVDVTLYVTGFVFVVVNLFMAYCVIKFRYRKGARATYEPENKKLETWLTGLTAVGVAAMLAPGLFVWAKFVDVPEEAHVVEGVGAPDHPPELAFVDHSLDAVDLVGVELPRLDPRPVDRVTLETGDARIQGERHELDWVFVGIGEAVPASGIRVGVDHGAEHVDSV